MNAAPANTQAPAARRGGRTVSLIVIHCAAVPDGRWTTAADIDLWHQKAGFYRAPEFRARQNQALAAIGYHFVVYTNGAVVTGRHLDEIGAHAIGFNHQSVGICMVGTRRYTEWQWRALAGCVRALAQKFGIPPAFAPVRARARDGGICGHRDLSGVNAQRECPGFSVEDWIEAGMHPLPGHVLTPFPFPQAQENER